jgi:hypothetical protein
VKSLAAVRPRTRTVPSIWSRVLDRTVSVRSMPSSASSDRGFGREEGIEPLELVMRPQTRTRCFCPEFSAPVRQKSYSPVVRGDRQRHPPGDSRGLLSREEEPARDSSERRRQHSSARGCLAKRERPLRVVGRAGEVSARARQLIARFGTSLAPYTTGESGPKADAAITVFCQWVITRVAAIYDARA